MREDCLWTEHSWVQLINIRSLFSTLLSPVMLLERHQCIYVAFIQVRKCIFNMVLPLQVMITSGNIVTTHSLISTQLPPVRVLERYQYIILYTLIL